MSRSMRNFFAKRILERKVLRLKHRQCEGRQCERRQFKSRHEKRAAVVDNFYVLFYGPDWLYTIFIVEKLTDELLSIAFHSKTSFLILAFKTFDVKIVDINTFPQKKLMQKNSFKSFFLIFEQTLKRLTETVKQTT